MMKFSNRFCMIVIIVISVFATIYGFGEKLDPTFNQIGTNRIGFGNGASSGKAVSIQSGGKYVVAGLCVDGRLFRNLCLARFNLSGDPDLTFGNRGIVIDIADGKDWNEGSLAIESQSDGKIVVGGSLNLSNGSYMAVFRYNNDGSSDQTFGNNGKVIGRIPGATGQIITSIGINSDGSILAAGSVNIGTSSNGKPLVVRLNHNGSIDTNFGTQGYITFETGSAGSSSTIASIKILQNENFVLAGSSTSSNGKTQIWVGRFMADGFSDLAFGNLGFSFVPFQPLSATAAAMTVLPEGTIVIAGNTISTTNQRSIALARLLPDGSLDTTFDFDGKLVCSTFDGAVKGLTGDQYGNLYLTGTSISFASRMFVVKIRGDGRFDKLFNHGQPRYDDSPQWTFGEAIRVESTDSIIVAGSQRISSVDTSGKMALFRISASGGSDLSFAERGVALANAGNEVSEAANLAIQSDGKILVVGYTGAYPNQRASISRFIDSGTLDPEFGDNGKIVVNIGTSSQFEFVVVLSNGSILTAGRAGTEMLLARFLPNGMPDPNFDSDGFLLSQAGYLARSVHVLPSGKILVGAESRYSSGLMTARFNDDGSLDATFGNSGIQMVPSSGTNGNLTAMAVQPDGKIVLTGWSRDAQFNYNAEIARLKSNGRIDKTFGNAGKISVDLDGGNEVQFGVYLQPDGKIVTVGRSGPESNLDSTVFRFNNDGSFDTSFGNAGRAFIGISSGEDTFRSAAIQADGKILAAGHTAWSGGDFTVVRFLPDGSVDHSFGSDGIFKVVFPTGMNAGRGVAIDHENRVVAVGYSAGTFGISRILSDVFSPFQENPPVTH